MKSPSVSPRRTLVAALLGLAVLPLAGRADDITPPVVANTIPAITVPAGTGRSIVKLTNTFALSGVTGEVVRFNTTLGTMNMELDAADYPLNVANFLSYVNSGAYNGTFIHRSVAGFIVQGGGYHVIADLNFPHIALAAAVKGEHKGNNLRGTIAFALTSGTNSADSGTSEWFFNLGDNPSLDDGSNNQGPFTAFGRLIEDGLTTMDAIGAVRTYDASSVVVSLDKSVFTALPLYNYTNAQGIDIDPDLIFINQASVVPLVPATAGGDSLLSLRVSTSNPALVTPVLSGRKLKLIYAPGQVGTAKIKVVATDDAGTTARLKFKVTVQ